MRTKRKVKANLPGAFARRRGKRSWLIIAPTGENGTPKIAGVGDTKRKAWRDAASNLLLIMMG